MLAFAVPKDATPQISRRKLSRIAIKPRKFTKVFSLESFPLYGTSCLGTRLFTAESDVKLGGAWERGYSLLKVMESWAEPGNEAIHC